MNHNALRRRVNPLLHSGPSEVLFGPGRVYLTVRIVCPFVAATRMPSSSRIAGVQVLAEFRSRGELPRRRFPATGNIGEPIAARTRARIDRRIGVITVVIHGGIAFW